MSFHFSKPFILAVIFVLAIGLRVSLAVVNRDANDPHWEVSRIILREHRLPAKDECFECFQPKLYHAFVAQTWMMLPSLELDTRIKAAQLINAAAGIMTILIVWLFLLKIPVGETSRLIAFALIALNPCLIAINSQATNDTFVILFGTAAIYCLYTFLATTNSVYFWGLTASVVFAAVSKGTGFVLFLAILLIILIKMVSSKNARLLPFLAAYLLVFSAVVPFAGEYYQRYQKYGSPLVTNKPVEPPPHFLKETSVLRPGTTSIVNSFLTFRLIDMLRTPYISNDFPIKPLHRTSLWSQLYGRTHFIFFDQWPYAWQTTKPALMHVGRVILVLALVPTAIFLIQLLKNVAQDVRLLIRRPEAFATEQIWMLDAILCAYLAFIVYLNYVYRDFSWMKSIYIFSCFACAACLLAQGLDTAFRNRPRLKKPVFAVCVLLIALYTCTIGALIYKLAAPT